MGRLVQPDHRGATLETLGVSPEMTSGDEFASRISKYIPSEVLAAYLALESVLTPKAAVANAVIATNAPATSIMEKLAPHLPLSIFVLCLAFTPLYIWSFSRKGGDPWLVHAGVATLAFCIWAYAMKGSIFMQALPNGMGLYDGQLAAALLVIFSLISGLIKPGEQRP